MKYYTIQNEQIITAENKSALSNFYDNIKELPSDYEIGKYIAVNDELVINPEYEKYILEKKEEIRSKLKLTKREVFLAIYKDKGITPEEIKSNIKDPIALIEFEYANEYYRGNPLIDIVGNSLGYTKEQLDYLFEYRTFSNPVEEVVE